MGKIGKSLNNNAGNETFQLGKVTVESSIFSWLIPPSKTPTPSAIATLPPTAQATLALLAPAPTKAAIVVSSSSAGGTGNSQPKPDPVQNNLPLVSAAVAAMAAAAAYAARRKREEDEAAKEEQDAKMRAKARARAEAEWDRASAKKKAEQERTSNVYAQLRRQEVEKERTSQTYATLRQQAAEKEHRKAIDDFRKGEHAPENVAVPHTTANKVLAEPMPTKNQTKNKDDNCGWWNLWCLWEKLFGGGSQSTATPTPPLPTPPVYITHAPTQPPTSTPIPFNANGERVVSTVQDFIAKGIPDLPNGMKFYNNDSSNTNCAIFVNWVLRNAGFGLPNLPPNTAGSFAKVGPSQQAYSAQNGEIRYVFNNGTIHRPDNTTQADILNALQQWNKLHPGSLPPGATVYLRGAEIDPNAHLPYNAHSDFDHEAILMNDDGQIAEMSGPSYWQQSNGQYLGSVPNNAQNLYQYTWSPSQPDSIVEHTLFDTSIPSETLVKGNPLTPFAQDYTVRRITTDFSIVPAQPIMPTANDMRNYGLSTDHTNWQAEYLDKTIENPQGKLCYLNLETQGKPF